MLRPSHLAILGALILAAPVAHAQQPAADSVKRTLLVPDAVWDGVADGPQKGWVVLVHGNRIEAVGPAAGFKAPAGTERISLPGTTLIPGMIEGHSHLFLHPYNETLWDDQVLKEKAGYRMAEAVAHARATLMAGITTTRDLGTEGVFDYDVQLKHAINDGVVPGPRILAVTRAIVATGSYGPRRTNYSFDPPQGGEEASGVEEITRVTRSQIGHGADWVKVYADYGWGPRGESRPTFTQEELNALVATATDAGRPVAAHANTPEGMKRAILASVTTIEHGGEGTPEVFQLMKNKGVALCPTLAASEAYAEYFAGYLPGRTPEPAGLKAKWASFKGGAGCRRHHLFRRRCRCLHPRHQRAGSRADGSARHDPARRGEGRHQRQRRDFPPERPWPHRGGVAGGPGGGEGGSDEGHLDSAQRRGGVEGRRAVPVT